MSPENVEIVRRSFDAWNEGDFQAIREYRIRDGLIASERVYLDREEALEAAGVRE